MNREKMKCVNIWGTNKVDRFKKKLIKNECTYFVDMFKDISLVW